MSYIFEAIMYLWGGALLTWYCSAFLIPKSGRHGRLLPLAVFGAAYVILRYAVEYLPAGYVPDPVLTILKTVAMSVFMFGLSFVFFKKETTKQMFLLISFFAMLDICSFVTVRVFTFVSDLYNWLLGEHLIHSISTTEQAAAYTTLYNGISHAVVFVIHAAICFLAVRSIAKGFTYKDKTLTPTDALAMTLPCVSMFAVSFAMRSVFFGMEGGEQILFGTSGVLFTASAVFLLLTLIFSVRMAQKSIQLHMEEKNTAVIREQIRQIKNHDEDGIYAQMRGLRHDMKNHLATIGLLMKSVTEGNADAGSELAKYMEKMDKAMEELDLSYDTGNAVSNVVLQQQYAESKQKSIRFSSDFMYPTELEIDAYDIAVVLSNALDNAFEACLSVPEPERFVRLGSRRKGSIFLIEISNSYNGAVTFDERTGLPVSSKPDVAEHGIGLSNIQNIARKYLGGIDIKLSERDGSKTFCLTVMLQGEG